MQEKSAEPSVGTRLRRLLRLRGQSIREFSEAAGIPYRTLQDYLAGKAKPGADQLARIAGAGIDVNFLLNGKARRMGVWIPDDAPPDDETYYVLADAEVINAVNRKAKDILNGLLQEHLKPGDDLTFDALFDAYLSLSIRLLEIFARTNPPLEEARKAGMSVKQVIDSILDATAQIIATRLLARSGESQ